MIVDDKIHILIDMQGHSAKNRLPIFFYKAAPIQITYWDRDHLGFQKLIISLKPSFDPKR